MNKSNQPQEDLEEQYLPDFTKLSNASLQKYRMYYNIECTEEELIDKVKKHFKSTLDINSHQLYEKIFKLKREEREEIKKQAFNSKKQIESDNKQKMNNTHKITKQSVQIATRPTLDKLKQKFSICSQQSLQYSICVSQKGIAVNQGDCQKEFNMLLHCMKQKN
ncbi:hypothetical protein ABPG74_003218 [Tetrahymena malaccensis]